MHAKEEEDLTKKRKKYQVLGMERTKTTVNHDHKNNSKETNIFKKTISFIRKIF